MKQEHSTQLRYERELRGWSRSYVADQVEVDVGTVGRWERGERMPHAHYRQKLCALFDMNAQELGFFSEMIEKPGLEGFVDTIALLDAHPSKMSLDVAVIADNPLIASPKEEVFTISAPVPRMQRRRILAKAGFLGLILLLGSVSSSISFSSPVLQKPPVLQSKRLDWLLDPNTNNWVNNLAWSPDGHSLASANNLVVVWDVQKGLLTRYYPILSSWVNDVSWSKNNMLAAANGDYQAGSLQIWQCPEEPLMFSLRRAYALRTVAWSPDGASLAFAGHAATVEVWNPITGCQVSQYIDSDSRIKGINRVKWSPDGHFLACATDEGTVHVWEVATGQLRTIYRGHRRRVVDLSWSPRGGFIASASVDKTARIWNALSGRTHVTYTRHTGEVHGISWSPDGKYVVSGSYDTTAHVWDSLMGRPVAVFGGHGAAIITVLWSTDGKTIALGRQYRGVEIWQSPV